MFESDVVLGISLTRRRAFDTPIVFESDVVLGISLTDRLRLHRRPTV